MRQSLLPLSTLLVSLLTVPVSAQNINLLPEGQTLITLSVTERVQVEQDTLVATLRVERDHRDAVALQSEINAAMAQALETVEGDEAVKVSTGYYSVYQYNTSPQGGRNNEVWRGSQSLTLEGQDAAKILALAGEIQEQGFLMSELSYVLSTARADEVRDSLMESAIARATANVERAARAMGKTDVDIAVLDVDAADVDAFRPEHVAGLERVVAEIARRWSTWE
jgi:predicted secreted protein